MHWYPSHKMITIVPWYYPPLIIKPIEFSVQQLPSPCAYTSWVDFSNLYDRTTFPQTRKGMEHLYPWYITGLHVAWYQAAKQQCQDQDLCVCDSRAQAQISSGQCLTRGCGGCYLVFHRYPFSNQALSRCDVICRVQGLLLERSPLSSLHPIFDDQTRNLGPFLMILHLPRFIYC